MLYCASRNINIIAIIICVCVPVPVCCVFKKKGGGGGVRGIEKRAGSSRNKDCIHNAEPTKLFSGHP